MPKSNMIGQYRTLTNNQPIRTIYSFWKLWRTLLLWTIQYRLYFGPWMEHWCRPQLVAGFLKGLRIANFEDWCFPQMTFWWWLKGSSVALSDPKLLHLTLFFCPASPAVGPHLSTGQTFHCLEGDGSVEGFLKSLSDPRESFVNPIGYLTGI
jgi:hypothetical protein